MVMQPLRSRRFRHEYFVFNDTEIQIHTSELPRTLTTATLLWMTRYYSLGYNGRSQNRKPQVSSGLDSPEDVSIPTAS